MANISFDVRAGRVRSSVKRDVPQTQKSVSDVIRELKEGMKKPTGEDYRERAIAIHGLVCARCGREFDHTNRHLLTVHHRDGNHHNNPPDGSNWENLCAYCHEDAHSREVLGEYFDGTSGGRDDAVMVYKDEFAGAGLGSLGAKLQEAMKKGKKK
ncbi:MAG: YajD family HNH nuclease [Syntrophales bacterium]|nr:YajD family HNH nuclease [Syntrophales bacterium]